jgi:hypothetical protein
MSWWSVAPLELQTGHLTIDGDVTVIIDLVLLAE